MIIYSINQYLESNSDLISTSGRGDITFRPFLSDDEEQSPLFIYQYSPDIKNGDMYYVNEDSIWYIILDNNIERGFHLQKIIIDLLNLSDNIQESNIDDTYGRLLYMKLNKTVQRQPTTVDGYYQLSSLFELCWVPLD